jgi:hypothetical protein
MSCTDPPRLRPRLRRFRVGQPFCLAGQPRATDPEEPALVMATQECDQVGRVCASRISTPKAEAPDPGDYSGCTGPNPYPSRLSKYAFGEVSAAGGK